MLLVIGALSSELRSLGPSPARGRVVERDGLLLLRTGPGLVPAKEAAGLIAASGATAVLHVGLAGGLRSGLSMGDLVVVTGTSDTVLSVDVGGALPESNEAWGVDPLRRALARLSDRMAQGAILTVDRFVPDAATKEAIGRAGPYLACEMEASPLAAAARQAGVHYAGLRAISDPCDVDVLGSPLTAAGRRQLLSPGVGLDAWRSVKGFRRAGRALDRALPLAIAAVQAIPSTSAPASATNSSGT